MTALTRRAPELMAVPLAVGLGLAVAITGGPGSVALVAAATLTAALSAFVMATSSRGTEASGHFLMTLSLGLLGLAVLLVTFNALQVTAGLAVADVALVASAGIALAHFIVARQPVPAPTWLILAGTGILVAGVVAGAGQADFSTNLVPAVRFAIALTLTPVLIGALTASSRPRRLVIGAWVLSAAANAAVGLSDFVGLTDVSSRFFPINNTNRLNALTSHPNHLGLICAMAIPIVIWGLRAPKDDSPFGRPASGVLLALLASGVYVSGSRAALIGAVAGCAVVVLLSARRARVAALMVALLAIGVVTVPTLATLSSDQTGKPDVFERLRGDAGAQESDAGRRTAFEEAQETFRSKPIFGDGFEKVRSAHDIYLQLLQAGGLVALVAFGLFAVGALRLGRELRRGAGSSHELVGALMAAMSVWLVVGLFQNAIYDRYLYLPVGLLLGIGAAAALRSEDG